MSLISTDKGILNFGVYKELFPIVIETYTLLESNKVSLKTYDYLYENTISNLLNILSYLSKGYNKFHPSEKSFLYSSSRDCVSQTQSNLLIISELNNSISKESLLNIYNQFEDKIKYYNGLIKKIEEKE